MRYIGLALWGYTSWLRYVVHSWVFTRVRIPARVSWPATDSATSLSFRQRPSGEFSTRSMPSGKPASARRFLERSGSNFTGGSARSKPKCLDVSGVAVRIAFPSSTFLMISSALTAARIACRTRLSLVGPSTGPTGLLVVSEWYVKIGMKIGRTLGGLEAQGRGGCAITH